MFQNYIDIVTNNENETKNIGYLLGKNLQSKSIILLQGELGCGKTIFTKGIAKGLGINDNIKSPTFTLIHEYYSGRLPLYHMDAYRLSNTSIYDLGIDEYLDDDAISVIEWPTSLSNLTINNYFLITFNKDINNLNKREIRLVGLGNKNAEIIKKLRDCI